MTNTDQVNNLYSGGKVCVAGISGTQMFFKENSKMKTGFINGNENDQIILSINGEGDNFRKLSNINLFYDENSKKNIFAKKELEAIKIYATILKQQKGEKITIFKQKKRKRYKRKQGFRPLETILLINKIEA